MKKLLLLFVCFLLSANMHSQCYSVSQITYAPDSFNLGTQVGIQLDDHYTDVIPLPFPFCYFGTTYDKFIIGSNGVVSFDTTWALSYCPWPIGMAIPMNNGHLACIFMPWEDLYYQADTSSHIYYNTYGTTPNRRFVISVHHAPLYSCTTQHFTGEVILYETSNNVEMHIQNKPLCVGWNSGQAIEGMQDMTGTQYAVVPGRNYPSQWTASNDAWLFAPNCCTMSTASNTETSSFRIYPNPSNDVLHFTANDDQTGEFSVTILDMTGRKIFSDELSAARLRTIDMQQRKGVYLLEVRGTNGERLVIQKIILQ